MMNLFSFNDFMGEVRKGVNQGLNVVNEAHKHVDSAW
jgi:hypothetical protein